MIRTRYSIIPAQGSCIKCSSCGREIEKLPCYTPTASFSTCIRNDDERNYYVCLGLGSPMCADCDEKIVDKASRIGTIHTWFAFACFAIAIALGLYLWLLADDLASPAGWFGVAIMFALMFYAMKSGSITDFFINSRMKVYVTPELKQAYDYFENNGWIQVENTSDPQKDYTPDSLGSDLDNICGEGKFCVLDNETGYIVDHKDPATLKEIYRGSVFFSQKYEVD